MLETLPATEPATERAAAAPRGRRLSRAAPIVVAGLAALTLWIAPLVLDTFAVNVLTRSMIYAVLAVTVDLLWGFAGILTFGQAAFFGIGAYATAMILAAYGATPLGIAAAIAAALVAPALLGLAVGWLSFYHRSTPLYASVISLVVPIVVVQLIYAGGEWTGSSSGLVGFDVLPFETEGYFRLAALFLIAVTLAAWILVRADAGRALVALRDNEARCAYLGLNPRRLQIRLTASLAAVAGLAGFLFANASGVVAPENAGFLFGTELVIWVALGGRGTLLGPVLGTVAIDYLAANLSGDLPFLWQLLLGSAFVVIIILLPGGLADLVGRLWRALPVGRRQPAPPRLVARAAGTEAAGPEVTGTEATGTPILKVENLAKAYGALTVLEGIDLEIRAGELVSLVGPNGAGKTTLMRCLSDGTEPFKGAIAVGGTPITGLTPNRIVGLGVGRKFQVASVFESLSVADCLRLARASHDGLSPVGRAETLGLPQPALDVLRMTGLDRQLTQPTRLLSHGQKQALELAMVVALEPRLILLDEPTAGLTKAERTTIGTVLKALTAEGRIAAVLVEHDLDFVREISSRIVVLHQGRLVLDGTVEDVVGSELVRTIYSGGAHG
ncbi:amino acid/amide ABC transporter membrane protein 2, HAAT family /amino acid/amide ABC transporter ATP-binding protein 1, HAAT family [Methylobacterium sp. UNC300MFChir4.1]|uniref:branched-chain amino acid ABC transporter ATP-binding protein/permease n=1 Tax=Methylobacterium sp. UNC300MFChir4.1 TaxID=1502747 RepID=UPI0008C0E653|nr:ATP-binding cassette domain-containing protein [Methylobacterium sp. UNC300MFChir4.1]SEP26226.1 amino acid/amide ABC transporter membrane protein 2, HAAT family /amino acid/amide ABC transporter ATP-binding protein 1, HAAT family [Methylobacterium sp. UNC300MFChir4.1]